MPLSVFFTQRMIDTSIAFVSGKSQINDIIFWVLLLVMSMFLLEGNTLFGNIIDINLQREINRNLSPAIILKYRKIEFSCFEDAKAADLFNLMGNAPQETIIGIFNMNIKVLAAFLSIIGVSLVFMQVSVWFTVLYLLVLFAVLWLKFRQSKEIYKAYINQSPAEREMQYLGKLMEDKRPLFEIVVFDAVDYILNKWKETSKRVFNQRYRTMLKLQKFSGLSIVMILAWICFLLFSLVRSLEGNNITVGLFVALMGTINSLLSMSKLLSYDISRVSQDYLKIQNYETFMKLPEITSSEDIQSPPAINTVCFDHVSFTYPNTGRKILDNLSFEISGASKIALVGKNGAGKSTVIKLLSKFYKPDSGVILINGKDLNDIPQEELGAMIGFIYQDFAKYSLTVRENIAFGNIEKLNDDNAVLAALHKGQCGALLPVLPKGIDSNLGKLEDDGVDLSGGQWQRLAIARACMSKGSFFVLDEPAASLDPIAESELYTGFAKLIEKRGCIMISHRLGSAKLMDRIIVIDEGKAIETGTHEELMKKNGLYAAMFNQQASWYKIENQKGE
jgi:ABC-type multidrug transport system fused ATPase/permease subunit